MENSMQVKRLKKKFKANSNRVILQYFNVGTPQRINNVLNRIKALSGNEVSKILTTLEKDFSGRHQDFRQILLDNYSQVEKYVENSNGISENRKLLIGSYFSKEYSVEAASLFNPSIVSHPDQKFMKPGMMRFVLSLRATGEGHISSIEFKSGIIDENNEVLFDEETRFATLPKKDETKKFNKNFLSDKVPNIDKEILKLLPESFTSSEAEKILSESEAKKNSVLHDQIKQIYDLLDSNYEIQFAEGASISERVIFPVSKSESHGMEDVRFVKFFNDDGSSTYFGTYTAYNGFSFRTQLIETKDFRIFKVHTLHGEAVQDKGMALFPRKINGKYVITSRQGGENLQIMYSDNLHSWKKFDLLQMPKEPWQFVQLGNCGSPVETEKGWLLITHSVGAFRKYSLGAMLLDLNDPSKIIGSLKTPLLEPNEEEREGYVPNVLYSCGSLVHSGELIIPYAMSDSSTGFAKVNLNELLEKIINGN
ncbi:MAG: glycoside hydrolase family 130 protein [Ignavibacteriaceae bacterium]